MTSNDPRDDRSDSGQQGLASGYGGHATVGIQFALTLLLFGALGGWLDSKFGTMPWLMIVGGCIGMVGGILSLIHRFPSDSGKNKGR